MKLTCFFSLSLVSIFVRSGLVKKKKKKRFLRIVNREENFHERMLFISLDGCKFVEYSDNTLTCTLKL